MAVGPSVWDALRGRFLATGEPCAVLAARTELVEQNVLAAYHDHLADSPARGLALLAVGGFGRRQLFPHSDVDLLLLVERPPSGAARDAIAAFLRTLWDSGLRVSHSVHTPRECLELHDDNIELGISLLDRRLLAGDRSLYERLQESPGSSQRRRRKLAEALCRLAQARHAKHQNTIFHLEPNVKESPGALRDLHLLEWLDQLREDLRIRSLCPEDLPAARQFLALLRCFLHFRSGRDDNLLTFDAQEELAQAAFRQLRSPEEWMRQYYACARAIFAAAGRAIQLCHGPPRSLLAGFFDWRSRLATADFTVSRENVLLKSPHQLVHDPALVLRLFRFLALHGLNLAPETERRIRAALPLIERLYSQPGPHWSAFFELLALPHASRALTAMNAAGVLGTLFPEWRRIECLVVRDFYHRYTIDEHTLRAIQALDELQVKAADRHRARLAELAKEIERPDLLRLSLLFHDVGKGDGGGRHIESSLELVDKVMERLQLPSPERQLVRFLIAHHLDLSEALTSRDPDDPATARLLAARIQTLERLKYLTLVTYADISAVHPSAMTPWRLELLWRFYMIVGRQLTRELATDRIEAGGSPDPERSAFLEGLPMRYLRTHSDEEIARHLLLARRCQQRGAAVELLRGHGVFSVTILTRDRPFLFASLAGALAGFGMNILKAEAFTNKRGLIVDTFVFEDPARTLDLNPTEVERLCQTLERVAVGKMRAADLLRMRPGRKRPSRSSRIQPQVGFDAVSSENATLIEIVAEDRPELLHDLARTISKAGCNIDLVLTDTRAHRALAVFYVTCQGGKLGPAQAAALREALIEAARSDA